jgi:hypothetical protein
MRVSDAIQGSDEWLETRLGRPTASNFGKLITPTGKASASAQGYIDELIAQRITGEIPEFFKSEAMQRGNDLEPIAKSLYEFTYDVDVKEVGLCLHDKYECGASPDGLIGLDGGLEIKCPLPHTPRLVSSGRWYTRKVYTTGAGLLVDYRAGMVGLHVLSSHLWRILIVRVYRDNAYITKLAEQVIRAVEMIETESSKWSRK